MDLNFCLVLSQKSYVPYADSAVAGRRCASEAPGYSVDIAALPQSLQSSDKLLLQEETSAFFHIYYVWVKPHPNTQLSGRESKPRPSENKTRILTNCVRGWAL